MCGITGFWSRPGQVADPGEVARRMAGAIAHRGPDDGGSWADPEAGIALGHRRLSILDLSPEGHQPMASSGGRYVVAFNGEIFNFAALRAELEALPAGRAPSFRGGSDTEVLLGAVEAWGLEAAVRRFVGMFAFALWDRGERRLHLVRDRLGIKPLFYGWAGHTLLFGSELKALRAHPAFRDEVDPGALALFLRHACVPAPYSIYRGIRKLRPGTILSVSGPGEDPGEPVPFWSAWEVAHQGAADPFRGSPEEAVEGLDALLRDAVALRMVADVPLGAFLSGGVDSSTVVALMQAQSARPVRTFSIGFREGGYDEAGHAAAVARHLGTDHTELYVTPAEAMSVIPRLPQMYDEPFADESQIPTFLVSQLARRDVTVALSGDGGDELFAGYNRHVWARRLSGRIGRLPRVARGAAARMMTALPPSRWDRVFAALEPVLPAGMRVRTPGYKLHKLAGVLGAEGAGGMYHALVSHWQDPARVVPGAVEPATALTGGPRPRLDATGTMMLLDLLTYLPDDVLTKVDRASMAVALEARVPLLDHRVVEYAWRLPLSLKLREGKSKWALRQVLYRYVPPALVERPKTGFGMPIGEWLRGPLRDWAEELLDERRMRQDGLLDPAPVREKWAAHLAGRGNWQYLLWDVLMYQAWSASRGAPQGALAAVP